MRTIIAFVALALLAIGPAVAESAKSFAHHAKGVHCASYYAPGHEKKRLHIAKCSSSSTGPSKILTTAK
jgi:hypothetical protein